MTYQSDQSTFAKIPAIGSYRPVYRDEAVNYCPGCHRTHWYVGRFSAECAFCGTALPLQEGSTRRSSSVHTHNNRPIFFTRQGC